MAYRGEKAMRDYVFAFVALAVVGYMLTPLFNEVAAAAAKLGGAL